MKGSPFASNRSPYASVRNHTANAATADIFRRQLCSFPAKRALDDYATAEVNSYWEHGEWRLADSSVIDGPYPVARFSPVRPSRRRRHGFEQILIGFNDEDLTPVTVLADMWIGPISNQPR